MSRGLYSHACKKPLRAELIRKVVNEEKERLDSAIKEMLARILRLEEQSGASGGVAAGATGEADG